MLVSKFLPFAAEVSLAIFVGQSTTKSCQLKIFKSQYLIDFLRNGPDFMHVCTCCYKK